MKRFNLLMSLGLAGAASLWLGRFQDPFAALMGFVILFLIFRGVSIRETLMTTLGFMAAVFVLPVSLWGAMAAFALVQGLAELKSRERRLCKDRFRESQKTAERILQEWA